jgi:TPR repeat protein
VPQDFGEAFKWYHLASDHSSSYAENVIGVAYEHGLYVAQDYAEAFRWYRRAANKIYERPVDTWIHSPQYNIGPCMRQVAARLRITSRRSCGSRWP